MIKVDISKCTGCRMCETACTFFHTGSINRNKSRIKVVNLYELGVDGPVVCLQCKERSCLDCPSQAITLGKWGEVKVSPTSCTLCGKCEKNCPIGAIEVFEEIVYTCDLCGGTTKCVQACTQGALTYQPGISETIALKKQQNLIKGFNPSEKRAVYLRKLGEKLRKGWMRKNA